MFLKLCVLLPCTSFYIKDNDKDNRTFQLFPFFWYIYILWHLDWFSSLEKWFLISFQFSLLLSFMTPSLKPPSPIPQAVEFYLKRVIIMYIFIWSLGGVKICIYREYICVLHMTLQYPNKNYYFHNLRTSSKIVFSARAHVTACTSSNVSELLYSKLRFWHLGSDHRYYTQNKYSNSHLHCLTS